MSSDLKVRTEVALIPLILKKIAGLWPNGGRNMLTLRLVQTTKEKSVKKTTVHQTLGSCSLPLAIRACTAIVISAHVMQMGAIESKPQSDTLPSYPMLLAHFLSALELWYWYCVHLSCSLPILSYSHLRLAENHLHRLKVPNPAKLASQKPPLASILLVLLNLASAGPRDVGECHQSHPVLLSCL